MKPTTFKRYVGETLRPALNCFDRFELPGSDGDLVEIYIASLEKMLLFIGEEMPSLADLLACPLQQGLRLHPILYHDEAIASNPLSTEKQMKSMLVYLSWRELERSLFLEDVWLSCGLHSAHGFGPTPQWFQRSNVTFGAASPVSSLARRLLLAT